VLGHLLLVGEQLGYAQLQRDHGVVDDGVDLLADGIRQALESALQIVLAHGSSFDDGRRPGEGATSTIPRTDEVIRSKDFGRLAHRTSYSRMTMSSETLD
jgi:hypothetical protein